MRGSLISADASRLYSTSAKRDQTGRDSLQSRLLERINTKKKENQQPEIYLEEELSSDEDEDKTEGTANEADDEGESGGYTSSNKLQFQSSTVYGTKFFDVRKSQGKPPMNHYGSSAGFEKKASFTNQVAKGAKDPPAIREYSENSRHLSQISANQLAQKNQIWKGYAATQSGFYRPKQEKVQII